MKSIYLAGGCFWGVEAFLQRQAGVQDTTVGYANGKTENPTYEQVCRENTGHAEAVLVEYDEQQLPLPRLLQKFWSIIDPTVLNRQGPDRGVQYRTGIYYTDAADLDLIKQSLADEQGRYQRPIVTEVEPLRNFYPAEEYHQDYLQKNPNGYCHIKLE